jgi:hypothetical protein
MMKKIFIGMGISSLVFLALNVRAHANTYRGACVIADEMQTELNNVMRFRGKHMPPGTKLNASALGTLKEMNDFIKIEVRLLHDVEDLCKSEGNGSSGGRKAFGKLLEFLSAQGDELAAFNRLTPLVSIASNGGQVEDGSPSPKNPARPPQAPSTNARPQGTAKAD